MTCISRTTSLTTYFFLNDRAPVPRAHTHHGTMPLCCYADVAGGIAMLAQGLEFDRQKNACKNGHITPLKTKMSPLKGTTLVGNTSSNRWSFRGHVSFQEGTHWFPLPPRRKLRIWQDSSRQPFWRCISYRKWWNVHCQVSFALISEGVC